MVLGIASLLTAGTLPAGLWKVLQAKQGREQEGKNGRSTSMVLERERGWQLECLRAPMENQS